MRRPSFARRSRALGLLALGLLCVLAPSLHASPPELPAPGDIDETGGETGEEQNLEQQRELEFQDHLGRGRRALQQRRHAEAIDEFTAALDIHDGDPEALRGRALAHKGATARGRCPRLAIEDLSLLAVYDPRGLWLSERGTAVAWMGECGDIYAEERRELAEELAVLAPGTVGRPSDIRVTAAELRVSEASVARLDAQRRQDHEAALAHLEAYRSEVAARNEIPLLSALWLEADLHQLLEQPALALESLERIVALHGENVEAVRKANRQIGDLQVQITVAEMQKLEAGLPNEAAEAAYNRGLAALRRRDVDQARAEFELAVQESPWFPKAHFYLGEVHARREEFPQAIESYKRAIAMERYDYAAYMALGLLYKKEFSGAEDEAARTNLDMALRLRPDLYVLHFHLGELYARFDKQRAIEHFNTYLDAGDPDDPHRDKASEAIHALEREVEKGDDRFVPPPLPSELRRLDPELHRLINEAYVYGAEHGEWDRAERLLLQAQDQFDDQPAYFNMLALVVEAQQNRPGQARTYWEQSLALEPDQAEIHERLGLMMPDTPEGVEHLYRAAELGSLIARYRLAKLLWDRYDLWNASEQLDIYLREAGPYDVYWDTARELRAHMDSVFLEIYLGGALLGLIVLAIPLALIWRRFRGSSLRQLLDRSPTSFPEVARILSLIRHEILKHNTSFLSDVGRALELDEPDAEARATLLARRLFGDESEPHPHLQGQQRGERRGIYGRFLGYVGELHKVARAHGVTLNLRRKDPTFKAMLAAFEDVAVNAKELRHPGGLRAGRKLELARVLSRAGDVLGRKAFEQLSGIIRSLCVAKVDHEFIARVYEEVATEDKFAHVQIAPLQIDGDAQRVRIFPTDLHDILANVLRNSLMSSAMYAQPPIGLGVSLVTEVDDITGLSSLVIRIKDRSPERLTNEMLRGRYVERGMGITADLLSRYDGSIAVESEPGWEKAVVLRFFTLDEGEGAGEASSTRGELGLTPVNA